MIWEKFYVEIQGAGAPLPLPGGAHADRAEAAAVDQYFLSPTEKIFVPICLRTPRDRLIIVL